MIGRPPMPLKDRFMSHVSKDADGHWRWTGGLDSSDRYGRFRLPQGQIPAHVAAYELFVGEIPDGWTVDHTCRLTICVNPEHLEAVTMAENRRRGSDVRLTMAEAQEIRILYMTGFDQITLAEMFGVCQPTISRIVNGKRWGKAKPIIRIHSIDQHVSWPA